VKSATAHSGAAGTGGRTSRQRPAAQQGPALVSRGERRTRCLPTRAPGLPGARWCGGAGPGEHGPHARCAHAARARRQVNEPTAARLLQPPYAERSPPPPPPYPNPLARAFAPVRSAARAARRQRELGALLRESALAPGAAPPRAQPPAAGAAAGARPQWQPRAAAPPLAAPVPGPTPPPAGGAPAGRRTASQAADGDSARGAPGAPLAAAGSGGAGDGPATAGSAAGRAAAPAAEAAAPQALRQHPRRAEQPGSEPDPFVFGPPAASAHDAAGGRAADAAAAAAGAAAGGAAPGPGGAADGAAPLQDALPQGAAAVQRYLEMLEVEEQGRVFALPHAEAAARQRQASCSGAGGDGAVRDGGADVVEQAGSAPSPHTLSGGRRQEAGGNGGAGEPVGMDVGPDKAPPAAVRGASGELDVDSGEPAAGAACAAPAGPAAAGAAAQALAWPPRQLRAQGRSGGRRAQSAARGPAQRSGPAQRPAPVAAAAPAPASRAARDAGPPGALAERAQGTGEAAPRPGGASEPGPASGPGPGPGSGAPAASAHPMVQERGVQAARLPEQGGPGQERAPSGGGQGAPAACADQESVRRWEAPDVHAAAGATGRGRDGAGPTRPAQEGPVDSEARAAVDALVQRCEARSHARSSLRAGRVGVHVYSGVFDAAAQGALQCVR